MVLKAPAKINLTLAVLGRREDGFHEIESWVTPIELFDDLEFNASDRYELVMTGEAKGVPSDSTNLVARAVEAFEKAVGYSIPVRIRLTKHIPVGAGLGGGSSDAAATLRGLNSVYGIPLEEVRLAELAASLGSDVPYFLNPRPAILRGRGDCLEMLQDSWQGWVALVCPSFSLSTAAVYGRHAAIVRQGSVRRDQPWRFTGRNAAALSKELFNDLHRAATECEPRLGQLLTRASSTGVREVHMTGSGSCLFAVFDKQGEAEDWAEMARSTLLDGGEIRVIRTLVRPAS